MLFTFSNSAHPALLKTWNRNGHLVDVVKQLGLQQRLTEQKQHDWNASPQAASLYCGLRDGVHFH